jgi:hypothetical protein
MSLIVGNFYESICLQPLRVNVRPVGLTVLQVCKIDRGTTCNLEFESVRKKEFGLWY